MNSTITKITPTRKYKCPFCDIRDTKIDLVSHVEKEHKEMIPSEYTAARVVYNYINNKKCGSCIVCGKETDWDEDRWKYKRLCNDPKCKKVLSDKADENMKNIYGKTNLLDDPEQQEKMMFNRSISGKYKFSDGGVFRYVGSYEKKALEFMNTVMEIKSNDLLVPGPVIEYTYKDKKLKYISDMYYIPYNLIIEIKDGGSNPNNRDMKEYREKQIAKEDTIRKDDVYNYIRLTDNKFDQLLDIFAELKYSMITDSAKFRIVRINEEVGGMAGCNDYNVGYIVPYGYSNVFDGNSTDGYAYTPSPSSNKLLIVDDEKHIKAKKATEFLKNKQFTIYSCDSNSDLDEFYYDALQKAKNNEIVEENYFFNKLVGSKPLLEGQLDNDPRFTLVDLESFNKINEIIESTVINEGKRYIPIELISTNECTKKNSILENLNGLDISMDADGYYVHETSGFLRSKSYPSLESLQEDNISPILYSMVLESYKGGND